MKITKEQLDQIIREELQQVDEIFGLTTAKSADAEQKRLSSVYIGHIRRAEKAMQDILLIVKGEVGPGLQSQVSQAIKAYEDKKTIDTGREERARPRLKEGWLDSWRASKKGEEGNDADTEPDDKLKRNNPNLTRAERDAYRTQYAKERAEREEGESAESKASAERHFAAMRKIPGQEKKHNIAMDKERDERRRAAEPKEFHPLSDRERPRRLKKFTE